MWTEKAKRVKTRTETLVNTFSDDSQSWKQVMEKEGRTQVVSGVGALATTRFGLICYDNCFIDLIGLFERQLDQTIWSDKKIMRFSKTLLNFFILSLF